MYVLMGGRHGGLMGSVLDSGLSVPGFEPWPGHYIVILGETLKSQSASLPPGL